MGFGINRRIVVGKIESTPGTAEWDLTSTFPTDAECNNRFINIEMTPDIAMDDEPGNVKNGDHAEFESYSGIRQGEITMQVPIVWGGAVTTTPEIDPYLRGCGLQKETYTTLGIGYIPKASKDCVSMTIAVFDINCGSTASKGYLFRGCMGEWEVSASLGGVWLLTLKYKGVYVGDYDVDPNTEWPSMTGVSEESPEKLLSTNVNLMGVTQTINSFNLVGGNDLKVIPDQATEEGIKQFYVADRKPRLSMDAIMQDVGTEDIFTTVTDQTTGSGNLIGDNWTISFPRAQMLTAAQSDVEGMVGNSHNLKLLRNSFSDSTSDSNLPYLDVEATVELLIGQRYEP